MTIIGAVDVIILLFSNHGFCMACYGVIQRFVDALYEGQRGSCVHVQRKSRVTCQILVTDEKFFEQKL
jgi:hypothetical protein